MIDLLRKLPDVLVGPAIACGVWFGFNYAVLADRLMAHVASESIIPACLAAIDLDEANLSTPKIPAILLGELARNPIAREFGALLESTLSPRYLTMSQKLARCQCSVERSHTSAKFDFAVHTASFRLITPQTVGDFRTTSVDLVMSGACGALAANPTRDR